MGRDPVTATSVCPETQVLQTDARLTALCWPM